MRLIWSMHTAEDRRYPGLRPDTVVEEGLLIERDVEVPRRDGGLLYGDVHCAEGSDKRWGSYRLVPAVSGGST